VITSDLTLDGFAVVPDVVEDHQVREWICLTETMLVCCEERGGVRNLLDFAEMRRLADSAALLDLVKPILGDHARVVRGILFDKTDGANWKVPWHQDKTIAVANRVELDGFGPWSVKAGVLHVQPPAAILEQMVSVRLHLDDCPATNGALRVIPGTHTGGKLTSSVISALTRAEKSTVCAIDAGGVVLMRPLLLHASSAAVIPGHRRVLHFDYAAAELPCGLRWAVEDRSGTDILVDCGGAATSEAQR
jgi:hypothetical protein